MKLILSRKGFDAGAGGTASPITPDGVMLSLPIPDKTSPVRYQDITLRGHPLGDVVEDLTRGKQKRHFGAHLDPDVLPSSYPRSEGWRGIFGQTDADQTVLAREGVGPGDIFVFFGWFRRAENVGGAWRFVKGAPNLHLLWGWLQVDQVLPVATSSIPAWANYHPHVASAKQRRNNTLYVAAETVSLGGETLAVPGAGAFERYDDRLRLTKPGAGRSLWSLPAWFAPRAGRQPLGYHRKPSRWSHVGDRVELQSVARGQEFVLDTKEYPEALAWLRALFQPMARDLRKARFRD